MVLQGMNKKQTANRINYIIIKKFINLIELSAPYFHRGTILLKIYRHKSDRGQLVIYSAKAQLFLQGEKHFPNQESELVESLPSILSQWLPWANCPLLCSGVLTHSESSPGVLEPSCSIIDHRSHQENSKWMRSHNIRLGQYKTGHDIVAQGLGV